MAKIIVVDDEPDMVELITDMLTPLGHEIITAFNGKEALEKLKETKADLILLDIMMPDIDGIEVCEKIKEDPDMGDIPVLMVTAKHENESKLDAIFVEADGYITKPFTLEELVKNVIQQLEKDAGEDEDE